MVIQSNVLLVVSPSSTVSDVVEALEIRGVIPYGYEYAVYTASSLWQSLSGHQTMSDLGVGSMRHLHFRMRVPGGASKS